LVCQTFMAAEKHQKRSKKVVFEYGGFKNKVHVSKTGWLKSA
jgi:hypothetical protein